MGRCCSGLMILFRLVQFVLSLAALGCGAYIIYEMVSLSNTAKDLQNLLDDFVKSTADDAGGKVDIKGKLDDTDIASAARFVQKILTPPLEFLQGTPARAIVLTVVSFWSVCVIIFLLIAQFKRKSHPRMNRRRVRVSLEMVTFLLWVIAVVCTALLALEFGSLALAGGVQSAFITRVLGKILEKRLVNMVTTDSDKKGLAQSIDIVGDMITIGIMSVLAIISAGVCACVSLLSLIVSCFVGCRTARERKKHGNQSPGTNGIPYTQMDGGYGPASPSIASTPVMTGVFTEKDNAYYQNVREVAPYHDSYSHSPPQHSYLLPQQSYPPPQQSYPPPQQSYSLPQQWSPPPPQLSPPPPQSSPPPQSHQHRNPSTNRQYIRKPVPNTQNSPYASSHGHGHQTGADPGTAY